MTHQVLVYGTLRPGTAPTVTIPGVMFNLGSYPGIKLEEAASAAVGSTLGQHTFTAEIVEVSDEVLARLDQYEGYYEDAPEASLYIRRRYVDVENGVDAWIYEYNNDFDPDRRVECGDWLTYTGEPRGRAYTFLGSDYDG
jgi:gamma-glutamylcyclotransferase (GGCT)/AIG2-like uncharacterized protein YtfP